MSDATWARVRVFYEDIVELDPAERTAYLDRHCPDPAIRREVESLLGYATPAAELFEQLAGSVATPERPDDIAVPAPHALRGEQVGPYRLLDELGRGGMGVVYLAERADGAFEQRVAVKLLPVGLRGAEGHRRFLAERQILARLQHPSIARLLDGGVTADGQPYIVMELVDGLPIDHWCDAAGLTVDERIKLFLEVCDTIAYAHRSLVVHRDIKPGNVLVTGESETKLLGQVKLLDFGIAALMAEGTTRAAEESGRVPLTPAWASPEQLAGERVTTATDVYALTALLYRLLVGTAPHELKGLSTVQIQHRVLHAPVAAPSEALLRHDAERLATIAACRRSQPAALRRRLRGDLDTILLRGLARHPEDRYGSPAALAADLRRHLARRPVLARPQSAGYRLRRFLGRHRTTTAAALVIVGLIGSLAALTLRHTRNLAAERDKAQLMTSLLIDVFTETAPGAAGTPSWSAQTILDRGTARIQERLAGRPLEQAGLLSTLGDVYRQLGFAERGLELLRQAQGLEGEVDIAPLEAARTSVRAGEAALAAGRPGEAAIDFRVALAAQEAALGHASPVLVRGLRGLAAAERSTGRPRVAVEILRRARGIQETTGATATPEYAGTLFDLSLSLESAGERAGLEEAFERTVQAFERLPSRRDAQFATSLCRLATLYDAHGDPERAWTVFQRAIQVHRRLFGAAHPRTLEVLTDGAEIAAHSGRLDRAGELADEAVRRSAEAAATSPGLGNRALLALARVRIAEGRFEEAAATLAGTDLLQAADPSPEALAARLALARIHRLQGRPAAARTVLVEALELERTGGGEPSPFHVALLTELGGVITDVGGAEAARAPLLRAAQAVQSRLAGGDPGRLQETLDLAEALIAAGDSSAAATLLVRAGERYRARYGSGDARVRTLDARLTRARESDRTAPGTGGDEVLAPGAADPLTIRTESPQNRAAPPVETASR